MMTPGELDLRIYQGLPFVAKLRVKRRVGETNPPTYVGENITGYTFLAQMRYSKYSSEVVQEFTCTILDQGNSDTTYGYFTISLTKEQTAAMLAPTARFRTLVYDVLMTRNSGVRELIVEGEVRVEQTVSRYA